LANSASTGGAYIFNSAPLNPKTVGRYGGNYDKMSASTQMYFYTSDPLTYAMVFSPLMPPTPGQWNAVPDIFGYTNPLKNHDINTLILALQAEMKKLGCPTL